MYLRVAVVVVVDVVRWLSFVVFCLLAAVMVIAGVAFGLLCVVCCLWLLFVGWLSVWC